MKRLILYLVALFFFGFVATGSATWLGDMLKAGIDPTGGEITFNVPVEFTDSVTATESGELKFFTASETLVTNATISLPDASLGFAQLSDGTNAALAQVATDGSVLSIASTGTVATTDTGSTLALFDDGTQAVIKNTSASNSTVSVVYFYIP